MPSADASMFNFQLLVALKVRYSQRITILRGNHESRQVCLASWQSEISSVNAFSIASLGIQP